MEQLALQEVYPQIREVGAELAAITPGKNSLPAQHPFAQIADRVGIGRDGKGRTFPVLWDKGNRVAHQFGLAHDFSEEAKGLYQSTGVDLDIINEGEACWMLPLASTYVIDQAGMIRHAVVTPDWRVRPDPKETLERLKQARTKLS